MSDKRIGNQYPTQSYILPYQITNNEEAVERRKKELYRRSEDEKNN
ncbi:MAG: hypothetical protein RR495_06540 [Anaerovoracaceae bacterium]